MKSKYYLIITTVVFAATTNVSAQGLLNKLKDKAKQEVNEVEKKTSPQNEQSKSKLSANVTRTVVVTLNPDEAFDYSENCIDLGSSLNQISFILNKRSANGTQCFSYKNGTRTPVTCPNADSNCGGTMQCNQYKLKEVSLTSDEGKKYLVAKTETHQMEVPAISDQQMKTMAAYMTKEQLEEAKKQLAEAAKQSKGQTYETPVNTTINFNGKQYGPFKQVSQFFLTPDAKNFYAVVTEDSKDGMALTYQMVTSASTATLSSPGLSPPSLCFVAPDQSEFGMYVMTNDQKFVILTSSNKTYTMSQEQVSGVWFEGNHVIALTTNYVWTKVYRDGQLIKTFNEGSHDPCNIFVTPDSKITEIKDNVISFADGDYFKFPLKVTLINSGGKTYFKWLALEDREVVVYQKPN
ncbi:MAG: hypothetical protein HYR67_09620 [Bacteroidetes bacterium]|nr:hypothetical protein [Bacteroidota bacterium]